MMAEEEKWVRRRQGRRCVIGMKNGVILPFGGQGHQSVFADDGGIGGHRIDDVVPVNVDDEAVCDGVHSIWLGLTEALRLAWICRQSTTTTTTVVDSGRSAAWRFDYMYRLDPKTSLERRVFIHFCSILKSKEAMAK